MNKLQCYTTLYLTLSHLRKNGYVTVTRVVGYGQKQHMFSVRFPNNSRKPEAAEEGSLNKACLFP